MKRWQVLVVLGARAVVVAALAFGLALAVVGLAAVLGSL